MIENALQRPNFPALRRHMETAVPVIVTGERRDPSVVEAPSDRVLLLRYDRAPELVALISALGWHLRHKVSSQEKDASVFVGKQTQAIRLLSSITFLASHAASEPLPVHPLRCFIFFVNLPMSRPSVFPAAQLHFFQLIRTASSSP
eukprot:477303-Hanusia_phi.AAC.1